MSVSPQQVERNRELNARVARAVRESELTGAEIAARLGIQPSNISRWLRQGAVPSAAVLHKLPYLLKVSPEWLLSNRGPMRSDGPTPAPNRTAAEFLAGGWQVLAEVQAALAQVREAWAARGGVTLDADGAQQAAQLGVSGSRAPRSRRRIQG